MTVTMGDEASLLRKFESLVNEYLSQPEPQRTRTDIVSAARTVFKNLFGRMPGSQHSAVDDSFALLEEAVEPTDFHTERLMNPETEMFEQYFDILTKSFKPDVLDEKELYVQALKDAMNGAKESIDIVVIRFFRVRGSQEYDFHGNIEKFDCTGIGTTEQIVCLISGTYMRFTAGDRSRSVTALAYMKTLDAFTRRRHGKEVIKMMLDISKKYAVALKHRYMGMAGEVQNEAARHFYNSGLRWPRGVYYAQPPLIWDRNTGEKSFYEVPEHLMIYPNGYDSIQKTDLLDMVRTIFFYWMILHHEENPDMAREAVANIKGYVMGKVFREFEESVMALPGDSCQLVEPLGSTILRLDAEHKLIMRKVTGAESEELIGMLPGIFDAHSVESAGETIRSYIRNEKNPFMTSEVYVATDLDGKVVGISGLYSIDTHTAPIGSGEKHIVARLGWFGISSNARGEGRGRALLRMTEEYARMLGARMLCIETSNNPLYGGARALYEKDGYAVSEEIPNYFGEGRQLVHYYRGTDGHPTDTFPNARAMPVRLTDNGMDSDSEFQRIAQLALKPNSNDKHISCRVMSVLEKDTPVGGFAITQYKWISEEVCWIRIFSKTSYEMTIQSAAHFGLMQEYRLIIFEVYGQDEEKVLDGMGYKSTSTIPDVYLSRQEWHAFMKSIENASPPQTSEMQKLASLEFILYWKRIQ